MTRESIDPILRKPIQNLQVSPEFRAMARANGYRTLYDILQWPVYMIPGKKRSGYRIVRELLDILEEHDLLYMLKE